MNIFEYWFILCDIPNHYKIQLINTYKNEEYIWKQIIKNVKLGEIKGQYINKLKNSWNERIINNFEKYIKSNNINILKFNSEDYPNKLLNIEDPPFVLFYKGSLDMLKFNKNVSIVGSRNCTSYGVEATRLITKELVKANIGVISGGARGIDSIAHKEAVAKGGNTIAILGSGIDVVYPKENYNLFQSIIEKGGIISEFLPGTPPHSYNFPRRNRIISALSDLLIVVEAGERSGTLLTANHALDQNKTVAVVPGSFFWSQSKGCNKLIRDGAHPITEVSDIFSLLGVNYTNGVKKGENNTLKNSLLKHLHNSPVHLEDLIKCTNIDIKILYELLFEMQLEDRIICLPGNYYARLS